MSRSVKKTPKRGITTASTEKEDKRVANRKNRRVNKVRVKTGSKEPLLLRESSNVWAFSKDGKKYLKNPRKKDLRK